MICVASKTIEHDLRLGTRFGGKPLGLESCVGHGTYRLYHVLDLLRISKQEVVERQAETDVRISTSRTQEHIVSRKFGGRILWHVWWVLQRREKIVVGLLVACVKQF